MFPRRLKSSIERQSARGRVPISSCLSFSVSIDHIAGSAMIPFGGRDFNLGGIGLSGLVRPLRGYSGGEC
jgi:hypothetical protein